ncbi:Asp-domain-containing protein [Gyrodon lividus]|nr:Asp-domain-containing protein [Gyrodon lividus]
MRFTLATVIAALPFFIAAAPQPAKQRGTAIPLSQHSSLVNDHMDANLEALNSHIASTTAKILRGFDNFEKNTGSSHPFAVKGARKRDSGGLPLSSLGDPLNRWFGTISVGTPPRNFAVLFDTGSSDLILPGIDCDYSCDSHAIYDPGASLTSAELGKPFNIKFTGGDAAFGYQYTDNVTIVGLTANHQTLGAAVHYSQGFQIEQFAGDGVLGMAFQAISDYYQSPFFQSLVTEGQTDEPIFAFSFAAPGPELYIGGTNPDMYNGDFAWAPVTQQGYWQVKIDSVVGNGQNVLTNVAGIIDTGSDLVYGPTSDVAALYAAIGGTPFRAGQGLYCFPCDAVPSVSFTFGGTSFPIPARNLNMGSFGDRSKCVGAIVPSTARSWVFGTRFLSSVYTAFDVSNGRIGFATLA